MPPIRIDDLRDKILRGLREDVLVLSGGVSMGKYDLVESVLERLGRGVLFDAVAIRPASPQFSQNAKTLSYSDYRQSRLHHGNVRVVRSSRDRSAQRRHRARFTISRSTPGGTPE